MNYRFDYQIQPLGKTANPSMWNGMPIPFQWSMYDRDATDKNGIKLYTRADIIKKIQDISDALPRCESLVLNWCAEIIRLWSDLLSRISGPEESNKLIIYVRYEKKYVV
jgi:hypothetical protein